MDTRAAIGRATTALIIEARKDCVGDLPAPVDLEASKDFPYYVHYTKKTRFSKLHKRGGCWRRPGRELKEVTYHEKLSDAPYMDYCSDCWPRSAPGLEDRSTTASSSSMSGDRGLSSESDSSSSDEGLA